MTADEQKSITVEALIRGTTERLAAAGLTYGHGTDNPIDEAAWMVFSHFGLSHEAAPAVYREFVDVQRLPDFQTLVERRIGERVPAAYLLNEAWFAGLEAAQAGTGMNAVYLPLSIAVVGIMMSEKIISGTTLSRESSASWPLATSCTSCPAAPPAGRV